MGVYQKQKRLREQQKSANLVLLAGKILLPMWASRRIKESRLGRVAILQHGAYDFRMLNH
jgi:hypothetical protein